MKKPSNKYHDYIFKDGSLLGEFDEMYKNSKEVPWHQDETARQVFVDIDIAIINHFVETNKLSMVADVGCGLGYVAARLKDELKIDASNFLTIGFEVSGEAVSRAASLHPEIEFVKHDIIHDDISAWEGKFDLLYIKDLLWYVAESADDVFQKVENLLRKGGYLYVLQSVPDKDEFVGSELFPGTLSIMKFLAERFHTVYSSSTYENNTGRVIGDYNLDKYVRFLGKKN